MVDGRSWVDLNFGCSTDRSGRAFATGNGRNRSVSCRRLELCEEELGYRRTKRGMVSMAPHTRTTRRNHRFCMVTSDDARQSRGEQPDLHSYSGGINGQQPAYWKYEDFLQLPTNPINCEECSTPNLDLFLSPDVIKPYLTTPLVGPNVNGFAYSYAIHPNTPNDSGAGMSYYDNVTNTVFYGFDWANPYQVGPNDTTAECSDERYHAHACGSLCILHEPSGYSPAGFIRECDGSVGREFERALSNGKLRARRMWTTIISSSKMAIAGRCWAIQTPLPIN